MSLILRLTLLCIATTLAANTWIKNPENGKKYLFYNDCVYSKSTAEAMCINGLGGTGLAIPNTASIQSFLINNVYDGTGSSTSCTAWKGFWTDGTLNFNTKQVLFSNGISIPFTSVNWDKSWNEPSAGQYCFGFRESSKEWHSVECNERNGFFCELEEDPTNLPTAQPTNIPSNTPSKYPSSAPTYETSNVSTNRWIKNPENGKKYLFYSDCVYGKSTAEDICINDLKGTGLAVPNTESIRSFLVNNVYDGTASSTSCAAWKGFWTDGQIDFHSKLVSFSNDESISFTAINWDDSWDEPSANQYCFGFRGSTKEWHSVLCNERNAFFCELDEQQITSDPTKDPSNSPTSPPNLEHYTTEYAHDEPTDYLKVTSTPNPVDKASTAFPRSVSMNLMICIMSLISVLCIGGGLS